jgi:6-phosphogluconolactonase
MKNRKISNRSEKLLINSLKAKLIKIYEKKIKIKNSRLSLLVAGGKSPLKLYRELSKISIDWSRVDFFLTDERFVSLKSINSNYRNIYNNFLKRIKINKKQIYFINTNLKSPNKASLNYQKKIKEYFKNKNIYFDIAILGMGLDGHVASIFSNNEYLKKTTITSVIVKKDFKRITLNLGIINNSKNIYLWLNEKKKVIAFKKYIKLNNKDVPVNFLKKNKTIIFEKSFIQQ